MKGGSHRLLIAGQARSLAGLFPGKFQSNLLNDNKFVTLMTEALKQFELLKTAEQILIFTKEINYAVLRIVL